MLHGISSAHAGIKGGGRAQMRCIMAAELKNGQKPQTLLGCNTGRFNSTKCIYGKLRDAVARSTRVKR